MECVWLSLKQRKCYPSQLASKTGNPYVVTYKQWLKTLILLNNFSHTTLHKEKVKLQEKQKKMDLKLNKKIEMMLDYNQTKLTSMFKQVCGVSKV